MRKLLCFGFVLMATAILGCGTGSKNHGGHGSSVAYYGFAKMQPTQGNKASGTIWFSEGFGKVKVEVNVTGLDPNSKHGFHIHEFGDCSASDGASAGGHFNPEINTHGSPDSDTHHAGDLGNLETNNRGEARSVFEVKGISINSGANPIIGRAVIIHKNPDDLISQPTGGAGARIACGVIGAATR